MKSKTTAGRNACRNIFALRITSMFLLTLLLVQFSFNVFAQNLRIKKQNVPLAVIFEEIRKQTKYDFIISDKILKKSKSISVDIKDSNINDALNQIFKSLSLNFKIENKVIIVTEKPPVKVTVAAANPVQELVLIKGIVKLKTGGDVISAPGVSVVEKGEKKAVVTEGNGSFSIRVKRNAILTFTMLGYKPQEVNVSNKTEINVILEEEMSALNEVLVTGYSTQQRREITGAVSSIKAKDIENSPIITLDQAIQGRMSGVNITTGSGAPGSAIKVEIRGQGSISAGNEPLYVVDGVPVNMNDGGTVASSNPLAFLDPKEIESIEVLKDAAAASIYGAEAANGVVLITTKRGNKGPTAIDFAYSSGLTAPMPLLEVLNTQQFIDSRIRAKLTYYPTYTSEQARSEVMGEMRLSTTLTDQEILALPSYDWQGETFRFGRSNKYNLGMSGGSDKTTFRLSGSYEDAEGSVIALLFRRATAAVRLNHTVNKKLSFNADINLATVRQEGAVGAIGSNTANSSPNHTAPMMLPINSVYKPDGSWNILEEGFPGFYRYNAIAAAFLNDRWSKTHSILGKLQMDYKVVKNLSLRSYAGIDYRNIVNNEYNDPRTNQVMSQQGVLAISQSYPITFTTTHHLTYNKIFAAKHKVNILGGFEYRNYSRNYYSTIGEGFPSYEFRTMASATTITSATGTWTGVKRASIFAKADYSYNQRYFISGIIRRDGSSKFGSNNLFGWFPAISGGWDIASEDFMSSLKSVDQLKLRVGYGETGNDKIGNFVARSLYGGSSYDGQPAMIPSNLGNEDVRWERNSTLNVGLDYSFFKRRIFGSLEVYKRLSKDLLLDIPIPFSTGFNNYLSNIGAVQNRGLEVEIGANIVKNKDFSWTSNFNISFLDNKVLELYENLSFLPSNSSVRVGLSLQTNFNNQYAGVNSASGRPMFYNANGEITYYPQGQGSSSYTFYGRGNRLSDYWGGWSNSFSYKQFSLDFLIQYDFGREMFNSLALRLSRIGSSLHNGGLWYYENQWTTPGQITSVPRVVQGNIEPGGLGADNASTRFLEDASYIRLKSINLSYALPSKFKSRLKLANASIFFQALNVFTLTKWTGYDPEFFIDGSNFNSNEGLIPHSRQYNLGINVKF